MIAQEFGWVGFAADIYGPGWEDGSTQGQQATLYRGNDTLFYGRIQAAVNVLKEHPMVLSDKIAVIGCKYCTITVVNVLPTGSSFLNPIIFNSMRRLLRRNGGPDLFIRGCHWHCRRRLFPWRPHPVSCHDEH